jgi:hypothetical protein
VINTYVQGEIDSDRYTHSTVIVKFSCLRVHSLVNVAKALLCRARTGATYR